MTDPVAVPAEVLRRERGWPTPMNMHRAADALDILTPAGYGGVLHWFADLCDGAPPPDWCGHAATIARLRKIEEAAPTVADPPLCTFHRRWQGACGRPENDPIHPRRDERMPHGGHVYRTTP